MKTRVCKRTVCSFICIALAMLLIPTHSFSPVAASIRISLAKQALSSVGSPPVILQQGTVGINSIYTNKTSALSSVESLNWLDGWNKRVKIAVNKSDISEAISDFPLLIYLSNSSSGENNDDVSFIFDELGNNRKKIAVTTSDGTSQCYVEIEKWDYTNQIAWLWTKVPNISNATNTELYLYYDTAYEDNTMYVGDTGSTAAQNVWESNFKGVWHLSETSGGIGLIKDSTSNNNSGTDYGNPTFNAAGPVNGAVSFDGTDDFINMSNSASLQLTSSLTIEAWVSLNSFGSGSDVDTILRKGEANPNDYQLAVHDGKLELSIEENDGGGLDSSSTLSATTWYYVVGTWDGSTRKLYLNNSEAGSGLKTGNISPDTRGIYIGGRAGTDLSTGIIDEVRASNKTRSAAWIKASFESERDSLIDFGLEERNALDYVDDNNSDVDSSSDIGTQTNFTAQQGSPDSIYDALTEGNTLTGNITYENSAESYSSVDSSSHSYSYSLLKSSGNERLVVVTVSWEDAEASAMISSLTFGGTAMTKIADVTVGTGYSEYVSLWYLLDASLPSSSGNYTIVATISQSITREIYLAVAEYSGVKQAAPDDSDYNANTVSGNVAITLTAVANGSLVVAAVGEGGTNVLTDTNNLSNLQSQLLTSSGSALGDHTNVASGNITVGWNNLNTREAMTGAVWQPSKTNYKLDLEVQWTNTSYTQTYEELCIKTGTTGIEDIKVDVWNSSAWINIISDLAPSSWNNISVSTYLNSSNFTIRFRSNDETNDRAQDVWNIDAAFLHVWSSVEITYYYVLGINNTISDPWQIRLRVYADSNINRLQDCTIYFTNLTGESADQIRIENGTYITSTGSWCGLGSSTTTYIAMTIQANSTGVSSINTYLEVRIPNTTTYAQYIIRFYIT